MKTPVPTSILHPWVFLLATFLLAGTLVASVGGVATEDKRPNILFLLTDDQTWEALGVTGGEVKTPHMDRLAGRGMLFTHGYNMGSWTGAVCVASRTMFNTGRTLWQCREMELAELAYRKARDAGTPTARPDPGPAWSQWFKAAGYRTYFAGKWHTFIHEVHPLFDEVGTVRGGMPKDDPEAYNRPAADGTRTWLPWDESRGGHWAGGRHWSAIVADEGIGFLKSAARRQEPFFMYLAFNAPHDPRQAPREYVEMYPLDQVKVPSNFLPDYPHRREIGLPDSQRDERLAPHPRTEFAVKVHRQEYYALVSYLDSQVGRILETLEQEGLAQNTVVFLTSDHGLSAGHHGLMGKQSMYEHSLRAPIIAAGPGIAPGRRTDARVYVQDIVPTTLELAGIPPPAQMEFRSLGSLLRGEVTQGRSRIYGAYFGFQRAVVEGNWKLIHYPVAKVYRLFDLRNDPNEMHDLVHDPAQAGRLAEMKRILAEEMKAHLDPLVHGESLMPASPKEL